MLVPGRPPVLMSRQRRKLPQCEFCMWALDSARTHVTASGERQMLWALLQRCRGDFCTSLKLACTERTVSRLPPCSGKEGTHALGEY